MTGPAGRTFVVVDEPLRVFDPTLLLPEDPPVTPPDFLLQARDNIDNQPCLTPDIVAVIQSALAASFEAAFPGAYVDNACVGSDPATQCAAFGVWLETPDDPSEAFQQARRTALDMDIGRTLSESVAFFIGSSLFATAAAQSFPPDPSSSVHLHPPLKLEFRSPDTIVTSVRGVDDDPTPDVSFTLSITEAFVSGPRLSPPWYTSTPHLDTDTTWVDLLGWVLSIPLAFSPWFLPIAFAGWYQAYEVTEASPPSEQGVGSSVATALMPLTIPIPGGLKIPIAYSLREGRHGDVMVDESGMYVGGNLLAPVPREPAVSLSGMTDVSVHIGGGDVNDTIQALPVDLRGNLTFDWTVNGESQGGNETSITLMFNPSIGPFGTHAVALTVTDEDGLAASAAMNVTCTLQQSHKVGGGESGNPIQPA